MVVERARPRLALRPASQGIRRRQYERGPRVRAPGKTVHAGPRGLGGLQLLYVF